MSEEETTLKELFDDIIEKRGPYSHDHLEHAENVIASASKNAQKIKDRLIAALKKMVRKGDNGEASDVAASARYLLKNLGEEE